MSLYGHSRKTTPLLEEWARNARVYDNGLATASSTVPSHASMFTGLLPSEHGANNSHQWLDDQFTTVAELFSAQGYQTYLFSANPHIAKGENFQQGFDVEEHPWDPKYLQQSLQIIAAKIQPQDRSSELARKVRAMHLQPWDIKACGEVAQRGAEEWLAAKDPDRPYFMFINYMEAHRPFIPAESFRRRLMTPAQVARSYQIDRSWTTMWSYVFGLHEYSAEELDVMAATYDASIAELDQRFNDLLESLRAKGHLENTIIVLTADHGEHLGEHHMLDHQYSLYSPLIHVPLIVHWPSRLQPGRDSRPVMTFDLFPTLLELAGIAPPPGLKTQARSLLSPQTDRVRLAEYPSPFRDPFVKVKERFPGFDPRPWERCLRAFHEGDQKLIWASDGRHEAYDLRLGDATADGGAALSVAAVERLSEQLEAYVRTLTPPPLMRGAAKGMSAEDLKRLEALGYVGNTGSQPGPVSDFCAPMPATPPPIP